MSPKSRRTYVKNLTGYTSHECSIKLTKELTLHPRREYDEDTIVEADITHLLDNERIMRTLEKYSKRGWVMIREEKEALTSPPKLKKKKRKSKKKVEPNA